MDVYLLDQLPADLSELDNAKPVASVTDLSTTGKAAIDFNPRGARYVALRWTPEAAGDRSLVVTEVNAFGYMPLAMLQFSEASDLFASNSSAIQGPSQSSPDISSTTLGTIAVPPALPYVSP